MKKNELEKELKEMKQLIDDEQNGIKSFCRPSAWLEELSKTNKIKDYL